jgi:hypothetical protein
MYRDYIQLALVVIACSYFVVKGFMYNKKMSHEMKRDRDEFKKAMHRN